MPNKDRSLNCGRVAAKIARFKSVNSEIIGRKFIKFVHDVARLLPFNEIPGYAPAVDFITTAGWEGEVGCSHILQ